VYIVTRGKDPLSESGEKKELDVEKQRN